MSKEFVAIRFSLLCDNGRAQPRMLGLFSHDQLIACKTVNGRGDVVEWKRHPGEAPAHLRIAFSPTYANL